MTNEPSPEDYEFNKHNTITNLNFSTGKREILKFFYDQNFVLIPVNDAKEPLIKWKEFENNKPSWEQILEWNQKFNNPNFAVMCGDISGGLVILDFEKIEDAIEFFGKENFEKLKESTVIVKTPHGGVHIYVIAKGNIPRRKTKIFGKAHEMDLLGTGGYALMPGSVLDHRTCKPEKPCDHQSMGEYRIISTSMEIMEAENVEEFIRKKAQKLGWDLKLNDAISKENPESDQYIDQIISDLMKRDSKFTKLMNGEYDPKQYPSRSEAEQALVTKLVEYYFSDDMIDKIMLKCKIGKWQEKPESYRKLTIRNARNWRRLKELEERKHKQAEEDEEINNIISKLHPDTWYDIDEKNNLKKFNLQKACDDFLKVFPNTITEYYGVIHVFTDRGYLKDGENFIKSVFERAGGLPPEHLGRIVEYIRNKTRVINPKLIDKPLDEIYALPEHLIPIDEGLLNVYEKVVIPHNPDFFYVSRIPRRYFPGAKAKIFREFLNTIFTNDPDRDIKITQIYEIFAWILSPGYIPHGVVIFLGSGGEGKSIIHKIMEEFIVETSAVTIKDLETDKFKRAELYGKYANIVSEAGENLIRSEWFKKVTDGTRILAERKNMHPFYFRSRAKWLIDTNMLPPFNDSSSALYRRIIAIIGFNNFLEDILSPEQIDRYVREILTQEELDCLFSEVIDDYYLPFIQRKKFTNQYSLEEAKQNYDRISNPSKAYIEDRIDADAILTDIEETKKYIEENHLPEEYFIAREQKSKREYVTLPKRFLEADAKEWAKTQKLPVDLVSTTTLGKALEAHGIKNITVKKKINETGINCYRDIFIKPFNINNYNLNNNIKTENEPNPGASSDQSSTPQKQPEPNPEPELDNFQKHKVPTVSLFSYPDNKKEKEKGEENNIGGTGTSCTTDPNNSDYESSSGDFGGSELSRNFIESETGKSPCVNGQQIMENKASVEQKSCSDSGTSSQNEEGKSSGQPEPPLPPKQPEPKQNLNPKPDMAEEFNKILNEIKSRNIIINERLSEIDYDEKRFLVYTLVPYRPDVAMRELGFSYVNMSKDGVLYERPFNIQALQGGE